MPQTHREFARKFVIMPPDGPRGGQRYRDEWQPVLGLLWDELDKNAWQEVAVTGPAQASKSFGALVVPTLRDVIALEVSPIVGVPEADMFADKWQKDFAPVVEASPELRRLLPESGSGARGGRVRDMVTFTNAQSIKVMSRGGKATNKAGFTSQRLRITEAAGFSEASQSETDEEADSYRQLVARLGAFDFLDPRRLVLIEGTGTIAEHLPWRLRGGDDDEETLISSKSRIVAPCPHCEGWISPEREHLVGWKHAKTAVEAYERARFVCPACGELIDDDQRRQSVADLRLIHHGQEITPAGDVVGPRPAVPRLWFRWSAWHNCLVNAGTTAVAEWEAAQAEEGTQEHENAERDLTQKKWAIPYKPIGVTDDRLKKEAIRKRTDRLSRGVLPVNTELVCIGIDPGKWTAHWAAVAFRSDGSEHIPAYGRFDVLREKGENIEDRLFHALQEFNDAIVLEGFPAEANGGFLLPVGVGIDVGDWPDEIAAALRTFGRGWKNRWLATRGRGISKRGVQNNGAYNHPRAISTATPKVGRQWYCQWNYDRRIPEVTFNADYWLRDMQDRLRSEVKRKDGVAVYRPGSMTLFAPDSPTEHVKFSNHLAAEQMEETKDPRTGLPRKEFVCRGDNHWSDAVKIARVTASYFGWKFPAPARDEQVESDSTSPQVESDSTSPGKKGKKGNFFAELRRR